MYTILLSVVIVFIRQESLPFASSFWRITKTIWKVKQDPADDEPNLIIKQPKNQRVRKMRKASVFVGLLEV